MAFIVLLDEKLSAEFLSIVGTDLFSSSNLWLVRTSCVDQFFPIDSQVFLFKETGDGIEINEVYSVDQDMEVLVRPFGSWSSRSGLVKNHLPLFERRKDFYGYEFQAETMHEPPYLVSDMEKLEVGEETRVGGIWGEIWHGTLEKTMNFSTIIRPSPDLQWGSVDDV